MSKQDDQMTVEVMRLEQEAKRLELMERQIALQEKQAAAFETQTERTAPKENPNYVAASEYLKPTGEPWAKDLKCPMYFGPMFYNDTPLTKAEVDALNKVQPVKGVSVKKVDGKSTVVDVVPTYNRVNGALEKLVIDVDLKNDQQPQHWPSIEDLANQLSAGVMVAA